MPSKIKLQLKNFFQSSSLNASGNKCKVAIEKNHSIAVVSRAYKKMYDEIFGSGSNFHELYIMGIFNEPL